MISSSGPSLDSILIERLRANGTNRAHAAGHCLFRQGDPSGNVLLVEVGTVDLYRLDDDGNQQLVDTVAGGGLIGDVDVLDQAPHSTTAVVTADAVVRHISAETFHTMLRTDAELQQAILQRAVSSLRVIATIAASIPFADLIRRVAAGLLDASQPLAAQRRLRVLSIAVVQAYIVL